MHYNDLITSFGPNYILFDINELKNYIKKYIIRKKNYFLIYLTINSSVKFRKVRKSFEIFKYFSKNFDFEKIFIFYFKCVFLKSSFLSYLDFLHCLLKEMKKKS
jgi:hypothetical protein